MFSFFKSSSSKPELPIPASALASRAVAESIEGMLSSFSMSVMQMILQFQFENDVKGDVVEFGTYRGRSAAILAGYMREGENLILVDVDENYLDRKAIAALYPKMTFVHTSSEKFPKAFKAYSQLSGKCRFVHVDSSHSFSTTFHELQMADHLIAPGGVVVLDDFTNLNFSQILAATYKYIYTQKTQLTPFLVTEEKGYFCRKADFDQLAAFVLERGVSGLARFGVDDGCIARTDINDEYRAFHMRRRLPGETGSRYGESIYGRFYKRP